MTLKDLGFSDKDIERIEKNAMTIYSYYIIGKLLLIVERLLFNEKKDL